MNKTEQKRMAEYGLHVHNQMVSAIRNGNKPEYEKYKAYAECVTEMMRKLGYMVTFGGFKRDEDGNVIVGTIDGWDYAMMDNPELVKRSNAR